MSYTPGPWFVPERTGTQYVEARIGGGWLQEVAACGPTEKPEEQRANARLIAAAPAMLEALELADAMLSGANMNAKVVERKVRGALSAARGDA